MQQPQHCRLCDAVFEIKCPLCKTLLCAKHAMTGCTQHRREFFEEQSKPPGGKRYRYAPGDMSDDDAFEDIGPSTSKRPQKGKDTFEPTGTSTSTSTPTSTSTSTPTFTSTSTSTSTSKRPLQKGTVKGKNVERHSNVEQQSKKTSTPKRPIKGNPKGAKKTEAPRYWLRSSTSRTDTQKCGIGPRGSYKKSDSCTKCLRNGWINTTHTRGTSSACPFNPKNELYGLIPQREGEAIPIEEFEVPPPRQSGSGIRMESVDEDSNDVDNEDSNDEDSNGEDSNDDDALKWLRSDVTYDELEDVSVTTDLLGSSQTLHEDYEDLWERSSQPGWRTEDVPPIRKDPLSVAKGKMLSTSEKGGSKKLDRTERFCIKTTFGPYCQSAELKNGLPELYDRYSQISFEGSRLLLLAVATILDDFRLPDVIELEGIGNFREVVRQKNEALKVFGSDNFMRSIYALVSLQKEGDDQPCASKDPAFERIRQRYHVIRGDVPYASSMGINNVLASASKEYSKSFKKNITGNLFPRVKRLIYDSLINYPGTAKSDWESPRDPNQTTSGGIRISVLVDYILDTICSNEERPASTDATVHVFVHGTHDEISQAVKSIDAGFEYQPSQVVTKAIQQCIRRIESSLSPEAKYPITQKAVDQRFWVFLPLLWMILGRFERVQNTSTPENLSRPTKRHLIDTYLKPMIKNAALQKKAANIIIDSVVKGVKAEKVVFRDKKLAVYSQQLRDVIQEIDQKLKSNTYVEDRFKQTRGTRLFHLAPQHSYTCRYMHIDNTTLARLAKECNVPEDSRKWDSLFKFRGNDQPLPKKFPYSSVEKDESKKKFENYISTDLVGMSWVCSRPESTSKNSITTGPCDLKNINVNDQVVAFDPGINQIAVTVTKADVYTEGSEQNSANLSKRQRRKAKLRIRRTTSQYSHPVTLSRAEWRSRNGFTKDASRQETRLNSTRNQYVIDTVRELSSGKTTSLQGIEQYIAQSVAAFQTLFEHYKADRRIRFAKYSRGQKATDNLIRKLLRNKESIVAYGSGSSFFGNRKVSQRLRGPPAPTLKFRDSLRTHPLCKGFCTVDEFRTSSVCPKCGFGRSSLESIRGQKDSLGNPGPKLHAVLSCNRCCTLWNRDVLGAINILHVFEHQRANDGAHPFRPAIETQTLPGT